MVVKGEVQVLPAGSSGAVQAVAQDRLGDGVEAIQALDVDVHELARALPLVA